MANPETGRAVRQEDKRSPRPTLPRMSYAERDGIWHIVARIEEAEAVTVCNLRIVQQTYLWEREPSPVCSRCKAG